MVNLTAFLVLIVSLGWRIGLPLAVLIVAGSVIFWRLYLSTRRRLKDPVIAASGVTAVIAVTLLLVLPEDGVGCHPSYPNRCILGVPPRLNCGDITDRNFRVRHDVPNPDPHGFDGDEDEVGCEAESP